MATTPAATLSAWTISSQRSMDCRSAFLKPAETNNGRVFRLRGLGMPQLKNPQEHGNLYACVEVKLPTNLSQAEKELLEKLRGLRK